MTYLLFIYQKISQQIKYNLIKLIPIIKFLYEIKKIWHFKKLWKNYKM